MGRGGRRDDYGSVQGTGRGQPIAGTTPAIGRPPTALRPGTVAYELAEMRAARDFKGEVGRLDALLKDLTSTPNPAYALRQLGFESVDQLRTMREAAMGELSKQAEATDPFSALIRDAALAQLRRRTTGSRQMSFVTGPRGIEGPMSNMIFGGGTSRVGS